jgi:hypothetical protein
MIRFISSFEDGTHVSLAGVEMFEVTALRMEPLGDTKTNAGKI